MTKQTFLKRWKNDRQGIAWVVGVAVISICLTPVIYFPLSMAWDNVSDAVTESYTFTGTAASAVTAVGLIISYLAIFSLIFTVAWAITNAKKQRYEN
jgi:uncharacterized integral membrane protein